MMTVRKQFWPVVGRGDLLTRCFTLFVFSLCLTACDRESSALGTPPHRDRVTTEHSEQSVFYHDMLEAYKRGDYEQARQLARKYLAPAYDELAAGKKAGWGRGLRVLGGMLVQENRLPSEKRFGGDEEFTAWLQEILLANLASSRSTPATDPREQTARRRFLKFAATQWILAVSERVPHEELANLYRAFQPELEAPGWATKAFTGLDDLLAVRDLRAANAVDFRVLDKVQAGRVIGIIRDYFEGLVAKDLARLESATGLDTETCSKLLDAYHDDCAEEGLASIRRIILNGLSGDDLRLHSVPRKPGFYTLTVKGIRLDAVRVDGSDVSRVIRKHLTLREQSGGRWIIVAPQR